LTRFLNFAKIKSVDVRNMLSDSRKNHRSKQNSAETCYQGCRVLRSSGATSTWSQRLRSFSHWGTWSQQWRFRVALRLRLDAADEATIDSFKDAPRHASYISWQTQIRYSIMATVHLFAMQIQSNCEGYGKHEVLLCISGRDIW